MNSVVKGTGYILVHTPDMVIHNGTTQTTERVVNPESEYLKELPSHLRSFQDVLAYWPNQTYIGNVTPAQLAEQGTSWVDMKCSVTDRHGKYGEIMPQAEFLLLMQICDCFDVVKLEKAFVAEHKAAIAEHPLFDEEMVGRLNEGVEISEIEHLVNEEHAEGLYHNNKLVGCVKRAHDIDVNLSAHVMHENLVSKASSVLALLHAVKNAGIDKSEVEYVIDCCEEACGDMNQRGGGNFAKAAAEIAGLPNATGSDTRGFCAGPAHAIVEAASLVKAGTYKTVIVTAGGCTAKLGMNGKDHVKKGLPILEDMLGGFAVVISQNDGVNPEIDLSILGRHTVGTGSAPQAVIGSLVADPLARAGLKITDIDKYSPEMQNPDITKPAGAGDVPLANYKMIAALAVKNGDLDKKAMPEFLTKHGLVGWAPTQGHIPSGVPFIGPARDEMLAGELNTAMIIGKGSLFLGRMTNLFDGVSFVIRKNSGEVEEGGVSTEKVKKLIAESFRQFAATLAVDDE
ncbi:glycine reductase [Pseudoflavonifractor sp. DSM 107456]|uniref:Glycine reductase n=2 Tax=Pseudoflavonifractor TaxID=1017280 RepID=A0ABR9RCQ3_9FIRM|nr:MULTISPECIES: glycine/sarcosine/betaine reductase complex component C subunit beta [Pseudoflavonifractor]MBC5731312.1 glycine reductase [Pseudoflavonifractor hominis]MBE5056481.1 glycine reductase [Pseudoflavonifractor gallinarum]MBS5134231.1 glycine reductase [Oscillospiraceae bacterium]